MILMIFALFITLFSAGAFISSTTYQAYDNSFSALNYSLPDLWIVTDIEEPLEQPFYDTKKVETTTIDHFKGNLKHYVDHFKVGFYYFDSETLEESKEQYVTGVRISLRAEVPFSSDYYKASTYLIKQVE